MIKPWLLILLLPFLSALSQADSIIYEIDAGPLGVALKALARQSKFQISYSEESINGLETAGLRGQFEIEQAIPLLLEGTGASYIFGQGLNIVIQLEPQTIHSKVQETPAAETPDKFLDEIIVTAQKNKNRLTDVPMVVATFSDSSLEERRVIRPIALDQQVSFLSVVSNGSAANYQLYLRGLGNDSVHQTAASPVGTYLDGVYIGGRLSLSTPLFDIDRIEVLKGPQGTLYGRNTTAGLINIIVKKPDTEGDFNGFGSIDYGRYNSAIIESAANIPLSDNIAARVAGLYSKADSPYKNINPNYTTHSIGGQETIGLRASLKIDADEKWNLITTAYYSKYDGEGIALKPIAAIDKDDPSLLTPCPRPDLGNPGCITWSTSDPFPNPNPLVQELDFEPIDKIDSFGIHILADYQIGKLSLYSTTAFDSAKSNHFGDWDGFPGTFIHTTFDSDFKSFSQELRLSSQSDRKLSWMLGLFYYEDTVKQWEFYNLIDTVDRGFFGNSVNFASIVDQKTKTFAGFGKFDYAITERILVSLGVRLTKDERRVDAFSFIPDEDFSRLMGNNPVPQNLGIQHIANSNKVTFLDPDLGILRNLGSNVLVPKGSKGGDSWTEPSGRLSLNYHWNDHVTLYGSVARGFNSGELDGSFDSESDLSAAEPEFITSYEIGVKGVFWQRQLRLNAALFHYDITNQQVSLNLIEAGNTTSEFFDLINAGSSKISGFELDAFALLGPSVTLDMRAAYLTTEYDKFQSDLNDTLSGNELPYAPSLDFSATLGYQLALPSIGGSMNMQTTFNYEGKRHFDPRNVDYLSQEDGYWIMGARATYAPPKGGWSIALWIENMTDQEYITGATDNQFLAGSITVFPGTPRTYGLKLTAEF